MAGSSARSRTPRRRTASRGPRGAPWCVRCSAAAAGIRRPAPTAGSGRDAWPSHSWTSSTRGARPSPIRALAIFGAVGQRHRRDRGRRGRPRSRRAPAACAALAAATRSKAPRKPCTCSALPLGRNGASQGRKPSAWTRSRRSRSSARLVVAGEGVLHDDDAAARARPHPARAGRPASRCATPRRSSSRSMSTPDSLRRVRRARSPAAPRAPARRPASALARPGIRAISGDEVLDRADHVVADGRR